MAKKSNRSPRSSVPSASVSSLRSRIYRDVVLRRSLPVIASGDRRLFHPAGVLRPVAATVRSARRLVPARKANQPSRLSIPERIGFAVPRKVLLCVRRKQRREVIHAKRLQSRGAGSRKTRNIWSDVKC
ncbi:MAG: hypothetical protein [Arizlama microvirus]|nr:MAG: hypothetical protein [Arizlama microvirus]